MLIAILDRRKPKSFVPDQWTADGTAKLLPVEARRRLGAVERCRQPLEMAVAHEEKRCPMNTIAARAGNDIDDAISGTSKLRCKTRGSDLELADEVFRQIAQRSAYDLHAPNSLTQGERELIATYTSHLNDCYFCQTVHGAIAAACLNDDEALVKRVKADFMTAEISEKLKSLLVIAAKVQRGGKHVTSEDIGAARQEGATDMEIHDTVLITAAFCMYNRYVDGLDTWQPQEEALYRERGKRRLAKDTLK